MLFTHLACIACIAVLSPLADAPDTPRSAQPGLELVAYAANDEASPLAWSGEEVQVREDVGFLWMRDGRQLAAFGRLRTGSVLSARPYAYWIGESDAQRLRDLEQALVGLGVPAEEAAATLAAHEERLRLASTWRALGAVEADGGAWSLFLIE